MLLKYNQFQQKISTTEGDLINFGNNNCPFYVNKKQTEEEFQKIKYFDDNLNTNEINDKEIKSIEDFDLQQTFFEAN